MIKVGPGTCSVSILSKEESAKSHSRHLKEAKMRNATLELCSLQGIRVLKNMQMLPVHEGEHQVALSFLPLCFNLDVSIGKL